MLIAILFLAADVATVRWATGGVLLLFALIAVLLFLARETTDQRYADYEKRQRAASAINGVWWEIVLSRAPDGAALVEALTLMHIRISVAEGRYEVEGRLFDCAGTEKATWHADAVALTSLAPVEVFYRWRGNSFRSDISAERDGTVNGIGTFRFDSTEDQGPCFSGNGWYSIGDVDRLQFNERRDVRLQRLTSDEWHILDASMQGHVPHQRRQLISKRAHEFGEIYHAKPGSSAI